MVVVDVGSVGRVLVFVVSEEWGMVSLSSRLSG